MQQKSKKFIALCNKYGVNPDNVNEVLSFEAACKITGDNPKGLPIVTQCPTRHQKRLISDLKLSVIAEALKTDLTGRIKNRKDPDYTNTESKYHAVFLVEGTKKKPSGSGLSSDVCGIWLSNSDVGVRLCFPNRDTAIFFGKHFLKLHKDHHLYT